MEDIKYKHLLGKKYILGEQDCYSICADFFRDNFNIHLTDYARPDDFWSQPDINVYVDNYKKEGFTLVRDNDIRPFDVYLISIPDPRNLSNSVVNHAAINLWDNFILHHRLDKVSCVEKYKPSLRNFTTHIVRHKNINDMRKKEFEKLDLFEILSEQKKRELNYGQEQN